MELEYKTDLLVPEIGQLLVAKGIYLGAINEQRPFVGPVKGAEDVEQGGLSCTGSAHDADNLPFLNVKVNALEHLKVAKRFVDVLRLNHACQLRVQKYGYLVN